MLHRLQCCLSYLISNSGTDMLPPTKNKMKLLVVLFFKKNLVLQIQVLTSFFFSFLYTIYVYVRLCIERERERENKLITEDKDSQWSVH